MEISNSFNGFIQEKIFYV